MLLNILIFRAIAIFPLVTVYKAVGMEMEGRFAGFFVVSKGLRVLGLNILGRFLSSREQNLKYVALETLQQLLKTDTAAVNRHRDTLLDCLKVQS